MVATNYPSSMESASQGIKSFVSKELDVIVIKRDWRSRCVFVFLSYYIVCILVMCCFIYLFYMDRYLFLYHLWILSAVSLLYVVLILLVYVRIP